MPPPSTPFQPYAEAHKEPRGPGDNRPTARQVIKDCKAEGTLRNKTILITGCSSGLGADTAKALYETGARLFLTARDIPKLEKVIDDIVSNAEIKDVPRPTGIEMHLDSLDGVRKGAEEFKQKSESLNILITNAGVMAIPLDKTTDGFERTIGTNHLSHFLLFNLLKPLLVTSAQSSNTTSRVIALSSAGHRISPIRFDDMHWQKDPASYNKWAAYGQSKTANVYMANAIARHYASSGVTALSVHPGMIATELGRHLDEEDFKFLNLDKLADKMKSQPQGAATTVWAAVSPQFEDISKGGQYLEDVGECGPSTEEKPTYADWAYNEGDEERLWKLSCEAVGIPEGY